MAKLYSHLKMFHFADKLAAMRSDELTAPLHVRLKPTNRCNHGCAYCCFRNPKLYLGQKMNPNDEIPREKMREIVDDLIAMNVRAVTFSGGGEPLLYPHLAETIELLTDKEIKVATLTNGSLLRGEIAERLGERATWVRVSMDAAEARSYARIRKVNEDEFGMVCANIAAFAKTKRSGCELGVNLIVNRQNSGEVFSFLRLMKELGANHVKLSEAVVSVNAAENIAAVREYGDAVRAQIDRARVELCDERFAVIDKILDCAVVDDERNNYRKLYTRCLFAQWLTVIAADQCVYTCQDKAYTDGGRLGSLRGQSLYQLWHGVEIKQRLAALNPSVACDHHCVAHEKNLALEDFLAADPMHLEFI